MKDNNILSTESYVISFRYITIYHLVFVYIDVYSWLSVQTTNPSLDQAIVEIYVYFLNFDPNDPDKARRERQALAEQAERAAQPVPAAAEEKGES